MRQPANFSSTIVKRSSRILTPRPKVVRRDLPMARQSRVNHSTTNVINDSPALGLLFSV